MPRRIEDFWREQEGTWWTSAFPFSRERFQAIWSDITEEQYTSAEAIAKHLAAGSGIAPPEFTRLLLERYTGKLYREDALEFQKGYTRPLALIQIAFVEVAHGAAAAAELLRQNPGFGNDEFIQRNLHWATSLIREDVTGRKCITLILNDEMKGEKVSGSKRKYYIDGFATSCDSFMAYSVVCEGYFKGELY
jgi:hypothetical protein